MARFPPVGRKEAGQLRPEKDPYETLVAPLREQIEAERTRADRERDRADQAEQRFAALLAQQRMPRRRWWRWRR